MGRALKIVGFMAAAVVLILVGAALGSSGGQTQRAAAPQANVDATVQVRVNATIAALPKPTAPVVAAPPTLTATIVAATLAPTATSSALALAHVGDRVVSGGIAITINSVNRTSSVGQFFKAKPGNVIVTADTLVENVSRGTTPYNAFYFKVKDSDGFEYTTGLGGDNAMKSGELAKSEKVRGTVSFEVPEKASGLVLSYQPIVLFGGYQVIRVSLED